MTLKEQIQDDLKDGAIWFDDDETAEWHNVNGKRVLCVPDPVGITPHRVGRQSGGIHRKASALLIRAKDFARRPEEDEAIKIDGVKYRIASVLDDLGVYRIEYGKYEDAARRRPGS